MVVPIIKFPKPIPQKLFFVVLIGIMMLQTLYLYRVSRTIETKIDTYIYTHANNKNIYMTYREGNQVLLRISNLENEVKNLKSNK